MLYASSFIIFNIAFLLRSSKISIMFFRIFSLNVSVNQSICKYYMLRMKNVGKTHCRRLLNQAYFDFDFFLIICMTQIDIVFAIVFVQGFHTSNVFMFNQVQKVLQNILYYIQCNTSKSFIYIYFYLFHNAFYSAVFLSHFL